MKSEFIIEKQTGNAFNVKKGGYITIVDLQGKQVVDFFAVNEDNHNEFLSTGVTIDCNDSLKVTVGDTIYTNLYNEMFEIIEDDVNEHDLLHPCCRPEMYDYFYKNGRGHRNCLDNINENLANLNMPKQNIIHPFNIFMHTVIKPDGKISVEEPLSKAGDKIKLQAKMDVIAIIAACSVSESKCNGGKCTSIKVVVEN
jgi:uncharacterized protein YcgI (DUF1989 family)